MRRGDGKPTSALEEWVRELKRKTVVKDDPPKKVAAPVFGEQVPRWSGRADFTPTPGIRNSNPFLQDVSGESYDHY